MLPLALALAQALTLALTLALALALTLALSAPLPGMTQSHFIRFCEPVPARRAVRRRRDAACAAALASEGQRANRQRLEAGLTGGTRGSAVAPSHGPSSPLGGPRQPERPCAP